MMIRSLKEDHENIDRENIDRENIKRICKTLHASSGFDPQWQYFQKGILQKKLEPDEKQVVHQIIQSALAQRRISKKDASFARQWIQGLTTGRPSEGQH